MGDRRRSRIGWALGIAVVGVAVAGAGGASGQGADAIVIDFEDVPANRSGSPAATVLTDQYRALGVTFDPATPIVFDDASFPPSPGFARSGSNVVTTCYGREFCNDPIAFEFDEPVESVGVWVGYSRTLPEAATIEATATAPEGTLVASDAVLLDPSDQPTPVTLPLFVADPRGRISRVVLRWSDPDRITGGIAIDDVEFTPFVERREISAEPELLELDLSGAPDDHVVTFTNSGNIGVAAAGAGLLDVDPRLTVADDGCVRVIEPDERCDVVLRLEPTGSQEEIATALVLRDRTGAPVAASRITAVPTTTTTLATVPGTSTTLGAGDDGDDGNDGNGFVVVPGGGAGGAAVVLVVAGIVVVGWAFARRRSGRTRDRGAPVAQVRPRRDPGRQTIDAAEPARAGALRARWSTDRTSFVLPESD